MFRKSLSLFVITLCVASCSDSSGSNGGPTDPPLFVSPDPDYTPPIPGLYSNIEIDVVGDGDVRYFDYFVPTDLPANAPVLIVLHGGGQNRTSVIDGRSGSSAWREVAEDNKVLLILPNGTGVDGDTNATVAWWNDCRIDQINGAEADDVAFLDALIDWAFLRPEFILEPERVYVAGEANGGLMAYRAALELSDSVAAAAAFIANRAANPDTSCATAEDESDPEPVSIAVWVGTQDVVMPFEGGDVLGGAGGSVVSAIETADFWNLRNQTSTSEPVFSYPDLDPGDFSTVISERFIEGTDDSEVLYVTVLGGGHSMPSIRYPSGGQQNRDVESAEEAWAFLSTQRR